MDARPHYTNAMTEIRSEDLETLLALTIQEDAPDGDATSDPIFGPDRQGQARIVSREPGVLCGVSVVNHLLGYDAGRCGEYLRMRPLLQDSDTFAAGDSLLELEGPLRTLLRLERPILNFLQYLSGISTVVAGAVELAGPDIAVLDTRKTLPGYRNLAKYAVYTGGGTNHRINLSDMAMIKDNHIAAAGSISLAAEKIRQARPEIPLEIEVDTLEQLDEVLKVKPRVVLLDNMGPELVARAIEKISVLPENERPFVEVSGGWKPEELKSLRGLGKLGVSMGYLTHTTRFLDLSMEILS